MRQAQNPNPAAPFPPPSVRVQEQARAVLRQIEAGQVPVSPRVMAMWLARINMVVRNPLPQQEFSVRARAFADLLADLPAAVFTERTLREVVRTAQFFPSVADVRVVLDPAAWVHRAPLYALRQIAHATPAPEPRGERSAAEVAAVRTAVAQIGTVFAEIAANRERQAARRDTVCRGT